MRRANTFPVGGVSNGIGRKTGGLPMKQKGFRLPFMNGGIGGQQRQQQQPAVDCNGLWCVKTRRYRCSHLERAFPLKVHARFKFHGFSTKSKADEQPSGQTVPAPAPPPSVSPTTVAVPAIPAPSTNRQGWGFVIQYVVVV